MHRDSAESLVTRDRLNRPLARAARLASYKRCAPRGRGPRDKGQLTPPGPAQAPPPAAERLLSCRREAVPPRLEGQPGSGVGGAGCGDRRGRARRRAVNNCFRSRA